MSLREAVTRVREGFTEHELLTRASAVSFQLFYATVPMFLFGLGLLGGTGLEEAWTRDVAPDLRESISAPAFRVIDDTVLQVLGERQVFWMTIGGLLAVWAMSGGMRALMAALDRLYGCRSRPWRRQMAVSIVLGLAVATLVLLATAAALLAPRLVDGAAETVARFARWPLVAVLLFALVWLIVRYAPAGHQPAGAVTVGSILVVVAWLATSAAYGWYVTSLADYGSVFGALATVIITLTYLYFASIAFLTGALLDGILRD